MMIIKTDTKDFRHSSQSEGNISSTIVAESEMVRYGGDEPYDPKEPRVSEEAESLERVKFDWDGPGDKENPQNWNLLYKTFIKVIACLLTINV